MSNIKIPKVGDYIAVRSDWLNNLSTGKSGKGISGWFTWGLVVDDVCGNFLTCHSYKRSTFKYTVHTRDLEVCKTEFQGPLDIEPEIVQANFKVDPMFIKPIVKRKNER